MKKICLLAGASSVHTMRWANAFVDRGFDVHLISLHKPLVGYDPRVNMHLISLPPTIGYFWCWSRVRRLLREIDPDILNTHYASGYGTLGRLAGFRPCVLSVWGSDVYEFPDKSRFHRNILLKNLKFADHLCSTSNVMADRVRQVWPEASPISVTPFGIECDRFAPRPQSERGGFVTIGTVKTLAPKYGISTLIRAFASARAQIATRCPDLSERLRLRLVGDGPQRAELERLASDLGVLDVTTFVGKVPHASVPDELAKLDVYCAFSEYESESFGVAIVEASACELPVIVSRVGGLVEVTRHMETGIHVNRGDVEQAASAIARLAEDEDLRCQLGKAGRRFVSSNFDWNENVDRLLDVLSTYSLR